jgi:hypothetical protein
MAHRPVCRRCRMELTVISPYGRIAS